MIFFKLLFQQRTRNLLLKLWIKHAHFSLSVWCERRTRLETNAEQWKSLLATLAELITWCEATSEAISRQYPVGGDLASVRGQHEQQQVSVTSSRSVRRQVLSGALNSVTLRRFLLP